jgi:hypothetical protein
MELQDSLLQLSVSFFASPSRTALDESGRLVAHRKGIFCASQKTFLADPQGTSQLPEAHAEPFEAPLEADFLYLLRLMHMQRECEGTYNPRVHALTSV